METRASTQFAYVVLSVCVSLPLVLPSSFFFSEYGDLCHKSRCFRGKVNSKHAGEEKEDDGTNGNGGRDIELAGVQPSSSNDTAAVSENPLHDEISKMPQKARRRSTKLPDDWQKYNDAEGRRYYTHAKTGQSQWEMPEGATKSI